MRNLKRSSIVVGGTLALVGGGIAFAAWTTTGTGTGSATAVDGDTLTVSVGAVGGLYPTGSVEVPFSVTNDNPYAVTLDQATPTNIATSAAGCNADAVTGAVVALTDTLAAGAESPQHVVVLSMSNGAADACKGATFTFDLDVTGQSAA